MSTEVKKVKSFFKQVFAILKGDTDEARAEKIYRGALSAFNVQIAALTGDQISLEDKLEAAKENLEKATINNGNLIDDRAQYINNILNRQNDVTSAEEALDKHKAKLAFLKKRMAALDKEEVAD